MRLSTKQLLPSLMHTIRIRTFIEIDPRIALDGAIVSTQRLIAVIQRGRKTHREGGRRRERSYILSEKLLLLSTK